ncbi:MAG: 5-methyltetrahydropteroyltriglutamate--homocysteine methyltransferase [Alphaproteobacteria bacterium]|nr:5-methyltetrahydropteroyltriglutamate--homocysteine methyltransferase [Alphaproteobacteria bacterium]
MDQRLLPTAPVGSYPQPDWLIDRAQLLGHGPPRVRARDIWRIPEGHLEAAQDDATILAVRDMERAGLDIVTDGEIRRESYSNRFATALDGVDIDTPGEVINRSGGKTLVPRVVGPIRRVRPVQVRDVEFLRSITDKAIKMTVPGPFTLSVQVVDEHYGDEEALAIAYADAVGEEVRELFAAGADIVQLDEPWMQARPEQAKNIAVKAINRALAGATGVTAVHMCFGYANMVKDKPSGYSFLPELEATEADQISIEAAQPRLDLSILETLGSKTIMVGVLDMADADAETPETVAERIRAALQHVPPERVIVAPDCGMKYLSRELAFAKLSAMVEGAEIVRREISA